MNESCHVYEWVTFAEHVLPVEYHHVCRRGPFWRQVACLQIYILLIANLPPSHSTLCRELLNTEACKSWKRESCSHWIDWFWLWGWLINKGAISINKGAICTRTAPLFWNFISLYQGPRPRLVRKIGSRNQSIDSHAKWLQICRQIL